MEYKPQVTHDHYNFEHYFFPGRWMSYYHQVREIATREDITRVLDIGPGTTFLKDVLAIHRPDVTYETLDVASDVGPDHLGSITEIPLADSSYDAVCAFQVLEHIEYKHVPTAVRELFRVSKKYVFISLPHFGPSVEFLLKIPFLKRLRLAYKIPFPKRHEFNGQHYWELGKRGYSVKRFRNLVAQFGNLEAEYVPFEYQYHRFFIVRLDD